MDYEKAEKIFRTYGKMLGAIFFLKNKILPEVLQEAEEMTTNGYSELSMCAGPLKQWHYVLSCYCAALGKYNDMGVSDTEAAEKAELLFWLAKSVIRDRALIAEINLSWSSFWAGCFGPENVDSMYEAAKQLLLQSENDRNILSSALILFENNQRLRD
jgi:hypothetical protein